MKHIEEHFSGNQIVRDIVIGMSDGLTVPFALAAGISGAIAATQIVVTAGLAEIVAGSIAMGLGGYLAAKSEAEHYKNELKREEREIVEKPEAEEREVREVLEQYGLSEEESQLIATSLKQRPQAWRDFMMRFELDLTEPDPRRARQSAFVIGGSYIAGGLMPLLPYMLFSDITTAFWWSVVTTLFALLIFGAAKGYFTGMGMVKSALQTSLVGGLAAAAAYGLAGLLG